MFLVVPFLGVVAVSWRTVLQAAGEPPAVGLTEEPDEPDVAPSNEAIQDAGASGLAGDGAIEPAT